MGRKSQPPMLARPWPVLALLFIANLLNFFDRQIPAAVTEPLRREFGLTDAALGWLGTAFIFLYAAAGIPFGRLADRCSRKRILAWGVGLWSLMTAATGLSRGFWSFFVSRMGVGLGEAACAPAATSLIGDLWGPERRARALSVFMLGLPAGLALSYLVSGLIAHYYGWRQAFLVAAVPGFAVAILIAGIREPARGAGDTIQVGSRRREGRPLRVVLAIPTMRWIILTGAVHNFMLYALSYFMSSLLVRHHGMDLRGAGAVSGFVTGIMGGAGMLLGGWLADASFARWRRGRLLTGAAGAALSLPAFWLAAAQPEGEALSFACWMGTAWLLMYLYYAPVYAAIQDLLEPSLRATGMSVYFFAMYLLGAAAGPVAMGWLSDRLTYRAALAADSAALAADSAALAADSAALAADSAALAANSAALETFRAAGLREAFQVVPLAGILLTAFLLAGARTVTADMDRLADWGREVEKEKGRR